MNEHTTDGMDLVPQPWVSEKQFVLCVGTVLKIQRKYRVPVVLV